MSRPKLLCIVMDQFRADLIDGALAHAIDLPNLRAFAKEAVSFTNHVTVTVPCGPSRASLWTGRYAMNHRSVRNGTPLAQDTPNIARLLRAEGYLPRLWGYTDTTRDPRTHAPRDPDLTTFETEMPGFETALAMRMDENWAWRAHLVANGYDLPPDGEAIWCPTGPEIDDPTFFAAEHSDTAFLTDKWLEAAAIETDRPWASFLNYLRPHPPLAAPAPYNRLYTPDEVPPPNRPMSRDALSDLHLYFGPLIERSRARTTVVNAPELDDSADTARRLRALYFGLATELDAHLGRIFAFLKESGQWDDTIVIVTSDHGEMLGDHHVWGKRSIHDASFRIPLLIRAPGATTGTKITAPTESIDLLPTILTLLGAEVPHYLDGHALVPWLTAAPPKTWRRATLSEMDFGHPVTPTPWQTALDLPLAAAQVAIYREARHTLVHFNGGLPPLLFDHEAEGEARNLADDPGHLSTLLRLTRALLDHRMCHADRTLSDYAVNATGAHLGA